MVALEQLLLQHLDSDLLGLPEWGSLTNIRSSLIHLQSFIIFSLFSQVPESP